MEESYLLIGGNGFLGGYTADALSRIGQVAVLDRPGSARERGGGVTQFEGSVSSRSDVQNAIEASDASAIIVLSSYSGSGLGLVRAAEMNPAGAIEVNVGGLMNVLEAVKTQPKRRVINLSSTTVYGGRESYAHQLVDENSHLDPRSIYAATKVMGEQLIRTYRDMHGLQATSVRPTLVWGPGIGDHSAQAPLTEMMRCARSGESALVSDSEERLDLIYVRDAGRAIAWVASSPDLGPVVIVNGYCSSIRDVREALVREVPGFTVEISGIAAPLGFPNVTDRMARDAGYEVKYNLVDSVRDYLQYR